MEPKLSTSSPDFANTNVGRSLYEHSVIIPRKELEELEAIANSKRDIRLIFDIIFHWGNARQFYSVETTINNKTDAIDLLKIKEVEGLIIKMTEDAEAKRQSIRSELYACQEYISKDILIPIFNRVD